MPTYYNEVNPFCCQWTENLMRVGLVSEGVVDGRSILAVCSAEIVEFERIHLFSGICGWELALQLAGWPADLPILTGSCPCQPFSVAGKRRGNADERHLWPEMFRVIRELRPPTIIGEQVAGKSGLLWFDGVRADLAGIGYACGMAVLPAACLGAPHKRERIFWVADPEGVARDRPLVRRDSGAHCRELGESWGEYLGMRCTDGKRRRVGVGVQPLAARLPGDLGRLLAWGNSIVPQVGTIFIRAYMGARGIDPQPPTLV